MSSQGSIKFAPHHQHQQFHSQYALDNYAQATFAQPAKIQVLHQQQHPSEVPRMNVQAAASTSTA